MLNKPIYHFAPAKNWMNDPNGTVYRNGTYHLFYQYNPEGSSWGNICWAYATSSDLINWQRKGIRLRPETHKGERYCFSGCALAQDDGYLIAYTSIGFEDWAIQQHARQRFARANADFTRIERLYDRDLNELSQPFAVQEWRDPFIFSYLGADYLLLCGVVWKNGKAENNVLLYRATNKECTAWAYVSTLFTDPERVIECPNMLVQNGKAALLYSTIGDRNVKYVAGDFDGTRLWERRRGAVDWSHKCFYATNLSECAEGGNVLYGWLQEDLKEGDSPDGERSGCLAMPRSIRIDDDYRLHFAPVPQLRSLQGEALGAVNNEIAGGGVRARLQFTTCGECRLHITESERERITVRVRDGEAIVGRVTHFPRAGETEERMAVGDGEKHTFDVLIDGSVAEFFVDGTAALSVRMYRTETPEKLFSLKEGRVEDLQAWRMQGASVIGE